VTALFLTVGVLGSLVLIVLRSVVADEMKGRIQRIITGSLENTIAALPPHVQDEWADEWRAELAAIIAMPLSAAFWVRSVSRSTPQLVVDSAVSRPMHHSLTDELERILRFTVEDATTLLAHLPSNALEREVPGSERHAYLDRCIIKPWGHELRVYDDRWIDVWRLAIDPGKGTSLHAHLQKDTCMICIGGEAVLATGAGEEIALAEGSIVHIRPGALHASPAHSTHAQLDLRRRGCAGTA